MSELVGRGVRLPSRKHGGMGLFGFNMHHLSLLSQERAARKERGPVLVELTDGSGWNLDSRVGVTWHLSYPGRGKKTVSSAQVKRLPTKWDAK